MISLKDIRKSDKENVLLDSNVLVVDFPLFPQVILVFFWGFYHLFFDCSVFGQLFFDQCADLRFLKLFG